MSKQKICFIAQFPPPIHGLSKAVDTLYKSELSKEFEFEKADITNNFDFLKNLKIISESKADLFYFTISQTRGGNLRDLAILKMLYMQHKRCLIHLHGGYYRTLVDFNLPKWQKILNYKAVSRIDGAIVLGSSLKWIFRGMLPENKIYVVPNCVDDIYLMTDEEFKEKMDGLTKRKVKHVLYLSNFIRSKGYPEVLEMAKLEKERVEAGGKRKFHFDFAGQFLKKKEKSFFYNYIKENGIEDYVTYHGVVDGKQKKMLLKMCDIFALITRYPNEGQPISILEAMGNGMMIVTTNHAGIPDIVKNGMNGIVVDENSSANTIYDQLHCSPEVLLRNRIFIRGFTESIYVKNMRTVFTEVIKRGI